MSTYIHPTAVIDPGAQIGEGTKVWHFCHVSGKAILGAHCKLGQNVFIADDVVLGDNCKVQNNVSIYTGVTCGNDVFLGPSMVFTNVTNPRSAINRQGAYAKTHVKDGVTIGANATIVCGVTLHKFAFIGAGAVVTQDVVAYALVVGNPGRLIGYMSEAGERLHFQDGTATCPATGCIYTVVDGVVSKENG